MMDSILKLLQLQEMQQGVKLVLNIVNNVKKILTLLIGLVLMLGLILIVELIRNIIRGFKN